MKINNKAGSNIKIGANIKPFGDRILVKELDIKSGDKQTASGIYIPAPTGEDKTTKRGTVIAVGSGKYIDGKKVAIEIKVGDTILFQWGDKITENGEEYYLVSESSVLASIK